jgi:hypothetical protein
LFALDLPTFKNGAPVGPGDIDGACVFVDFAFFPAFPALPASRNGAFVGPGDIDGACVFVDFRSKIFPPPFDDLSKIFELFAAFPLPAFPLPLCLDSLRVI